MNARAIPIVAALLLLLPGCRSGEGSADDPVLATIDGKPITAAQVDERIADVPRLARPEYSGPIGRTRMLKKMIEDDVLYRAAVDEGIDRQDDVRQAIEDATRQTVVQAYLDKMHDKAAQVSDEEAQAFYDAHQDEYRTETMLRVRVLLTPDERIAKRAYQMVSGDDLKFADACTRFSENPYIVAARGLIPTWVRKGRAVPWIGNHPEFHDHVFALEKDQLSEPFQVADGWMIARVEDVRESRQRPFEEVRDDVIGRIVRQRTTSGLPDLLAQLKDRYHVVMRDEPGAKSADELFAEAQSAPQPARRVELYRELVERFPEDTHAVDSQFMIGFLLSEEMHDSTAAEAALKKVIEMAPESDLAQSARWMLTSGKEDPVFEDDGWAAGAGADGDSS